MAWLWILAFISPAMAMRKQRALRFGEQGAFFRLNWWRLVSLLTLPGVTLALVLLLVDLQSGDTMEVAASLQRRNSTMAFDAFGTLWMFFVIPLQIADLARHLRLPEPTPEQNSASPLTS